MPRPLRLSLPVRGLLLSFHRPSCSLFAAGRELLVFHFMSFAFGGGGSMSSSTRAFELAAAAVGFFCFFLVGDGVLPFWGLAAAFTQHVHGKGRHVETTHARPCTLRQRWWCLCMSVAGHPSTLRSSPPSMHRRGVAPQQLRQPMSISFHTPHTHTGTSPPRQQARATAVRVHGFVKEKPAAVDLGCGGERTW